MFHKSASRYRNEVPKAGNSPLHVIREGGLSLFGSHGEGAGLGCLIALREFQSRPKNFLSQKLFNFFSKQVFFMFQEY